MSEAPLNNMLPRSIDPRKFAQQGIEVSGNIPVSALPRLQEVVVSSDANAAVELRFGVNEEGKKVLHGTVQAQVEVTCQRCLEPMPLSIDGELSLGIVWSEEEAVSLPKSLDPWIAADGPADIYEVVEEELLLSLPMISYHQYDCVDKSLLKPEESVEETEPVDNPFKVLEQLKSSPKS